MDAKSYKRLSITERAAVVSDPSSSAMTPIEAKSSMPGPTARERVRRAPTLRDRVEYLAAAGVLRLLGVLPRALACGVCEVLALASYYLWPRLGKVGLFNLELAFPELSRRERRRILLRTFRNLGRMLADFASFPRLNRENIERLIVYDGFEHYAQARDRGQGVIFLTGHFGNWELSSFAHSLYGYPLNFTVRQMDNPLLDALITKYRTLSGGRPVEKNDFARRALQALKQGEAVGVLMDTNMLASEGIFVELLGRLACTTTAPARLARKTGAGLVLGLAIWDSTLGKYRLRFEPVPWIAHEDAEQEIRLNTANFTRLLEDYIRRYPDQWLWVHRRWKTRPTGEPPLYPF
jgi:KDO2-lipid IV(A) lauroyltransferase